jgi:hypothetical protein
MKICQNCGNSNGDDAKFCVSCGSNVSEVRAAPQQTNHQQYTPPQTSVGFGDKATGEHLIMHCTHCGNQGQENFSKDSGRLDSKWGMTSFKVIMMSCNKCGHVELFNKGRSIFDFD